MIIPEEFPTHYATPEIRLEEFQVFNRIRETLKCPLNLSYLDDAKSWMKSKLESSFRRY